MRENPTRAGARAARRHRQIVRRLILRRVTILVALLVIAVALAHTIPAGRFDGLSLVGVITTILLVVWYVRYYLRSTQ